MTFKTIWLAPSLLVLTFTVSPVLADRAHDLAAQAGTLQPTKCKDVPDFKACHAKYPAGCGKTAKSNYDSYLNFLKNQVPDPALALNRIFSELKDFQSLDEATPPGLKRSNHAEHAETLADQGEGNIFGVIGYLYAVTREHEESTNCYLDDGVNTDFHIWIGFDEEVATKLRGGWKPKGAALREIKQEGVIVEMTPHYRAQHHPKWTLTRVRAQVGRQVKVIGQLMNDNEHLIPTQNCAHPDADFDKCWRGSAWELHPVIQFYVCPSPGTPCSEDSPSWKKLDDLP